MSVTPEMLYFQLGSLAAETSELATGPITPEQKEWIARAAALVDLTCGLAEISMPSDGQTRRSHG
jgi:hypothetical protein